MNDPEHRIQEFITNDLGWEGAPPDRDTPLLESEAIDSLAVYQLVLFLEAEYGIEVSDEELVPANFGTILSIARLVQDRAVRA